MNLLICTLKFLSKNGRKHWILLIYLIFDVNKITITYTDYNHNSYIYYLYHLSVTMCGYFATVLTVLYEPEVVDDVADYLIDAFSLPDDIKLFCLQQFLPEIRNATNYIDLPSDEFFKFEGNTWTTVFKLVYAFLWQVCDCCFL